MTNDVTVKLKLTGIRKITRGAAATKLVAQRAQRGADAAGPGFEAVVNPHKHTARAFVRTADEEGRRREAEGKVLNRALDAMR